MNIISFAWTTKVLLEGKKTVTRRYWSDAYAKRFRPGDMVQAYDRNPRFGGKRIATIMIKKVFKQPLELVTDEDERKEGGLWGSAKDFVAAIRVTGKIPYVVEFVVFAKG